MKRLLHNRIDPTVELLRKKQPILKQKRTNKNKTTTSVPPIGAPNWCLNEEALRRLGRSTDNIPSYDPEDDDIDDIDDDIDDRSLDHQNINEDDDDNNAESSKRRKKKSKHKKKKSKKLKTRK